jgi:protocatechuate 3,4-dioxygenase beta subunit
VAFHTDDGAFTLDDVPAGRWDVEVRASGYESGRAAAVVVEEGATAEGVEVRLGKGAVLSGRVLDARSGAPVREASVRADLQGDAGGPRMRFDGDGERAASSDADGRFEIAGLPPGTYAVTATHPEWSEASEKVELKEATASVDIRMSAGSAIGGVVVGNGQRPVAGASVALSAGGGGMMGPFDGSDQSTLTDASGRFRFERLNPARYTLTASLRTQSTSPLEVVLQAGDPGRDVTLTLNAGATLRGLVTGLSDALRANVNVSASGPEEFFGSTRTAADGSFEFTGVPAGPISLNARAGDMLGGSRSASAQVVVPEGQLEASAEIVFEEGFRLEGRVTRGSRPLSDAMVNAFPEGGGRGGASARTDESGAFVLEGLQAGTYNVAAFAMSGGGAPIRKTVSVSGDTTVDLEAPLARLAGTVVEAATERPLAEAMVRIEEQGRGFMGMSAASSDSNGRFALEDLEPQSYRVTVQKAAYQTETRTVTATEGSGDIVFELRRGEGIGVEAKDGIYGVPLRGLNVRVQDGSGTAVFTGSVPLDSEGRGEIPSLRPGTYALRVEAQGYAPLSVAQVAVPAPSIPLVLTPGGRLEIQAGPVTLALPNASARILHADGTLYFPFIFSPDGLIRLTNPIRRLENVAPGSYVLAVEGGARKAFEVREGGQVVVSLP